jgi:hypothetical protein
MIDILVVHDAYCDLQTSARIPARQVLVETGCLLEHGTLLSLGIKVERRTSA